jgi:hypothetical protein
MSHGLPERYAVLPPTPDEVLIALQAWTMDIRNLPIGQPLEPEEQFPYAARLLSQTEESLQLVLRGMGEIILPAAGLALTDDRLTSFLAGVMAALEITERVTQQRLELGEV